MILKSVLGYASKHPIATYYAGGVEAWLTSIIPLTYFNPEWTHQVAEKVSLILDAAKDTLADIITAGWPGT